MWLLLTLTWGYVSGPEPRAMSGCRGMEPIQSKTNFCCCGSNAIECNIYPFRGPILIPYTILLKKMSCYNPNQNLHVTFPCVLKLQKLKFLSLYLVLNSYHFSSGECSEKQPVLLFLHIARFLLACTIIPFGYERGCWFQSNILLDSAVSPSTHRVT